MDEGFYFNENDDMEDISSTSASYRKKSEYAKSVKRTNPIADYSDKVYKNLGKVIKTIAFIIAFFIIAVSFVLAFFLYTSDKFLMAIALAVIIFGTAVAAVVLFLIYGLGQVLCQNTEILKRLDQDKF